MPFPAILELSALPASSGFVINGATASDQSGWSVSSAGDVNGDGIGDLIIGARYADPNNQDRAGASYVVFGRCTAVAGTLGPQSNSLPSTAAMGSPSTATKPATRAALPSAPPAT